MHNNDNVDLNFKSNSSVITKFEIWNFEILIFWNGKNRKLEWRTWCLYLAALLLLVEFCAELRMNCCCCSECCSGVNEVTLQLAETAVGDADAADAGLKHDAPWPIEASSRGSAWTPAARSLRPWLTTPARRIWDRLTGDDASDVSGAPLPTLAPSASAPSLASDSAFRISYHQQPFATLLLPWLLLLLLSLLLLLLLSLLIFFACCSSSYIFGWNDRLILLFFYTHLLLPFSQSIDSISFYYGFNFFNFLWRWRRRRRNKSTVACCVSLK